MFIHPCTQIHDLSHSLSFPFSLFSSLSFPFSLFFIHSLSLSFAVIQALKRTTYTRMITYTHRDTYVTTCTLAHAHARMKTSDWVFPYTHTDTHTHMHSLSLSRPCTRTNITVTQYSTITRTVHLTKMHTQEHIHTTDNTHAHLTHRLLPLKPLAYTHTHTQA
jgi:hypothetical protein